MKIKFFFFFLFVVILSAPRAEAIFEDKEKNDLKTEIENLKKENTRLARDLETVTSDRDNILKQAKIFMRDKEELVTKVEEMKNVGSESKLEAESLKKENEMLKSEIEKIKAARERDRALGREDKQALEKRIADLDAHSNSLASMMKDYPPDKIRQMVEDTGRLQAENKRMAERVLAAEKKSDEWKRQMTPFQLDREELHRVQAENRELNKRIRYIGKLEERQKQLLKENTEYRERLEVLKAKFKEAVPGLAKSSRISQKMMRENADMHYNLGTIFLHNKQYREAIKEYEQVLELRPNDPETHYNLGVLYDDYMRDRDKSLYHYQKYLAVNPKAEDAKRVESYILNLELEQKIR